VSREGNEVCCGMLSVCLSVYLSVTHAELERKEMHVRVPLRSEFCRGKEVRMIRGLLSSGEMACSRIVSLRRPGYSSRAVHVDKLALCTFFSECFLSFS
jgi:hypothetical protein